MQNDIMSFWGATGKQSVDCDLERSTFEKKSELFVTVLQQISNFQYQI